MNIQVINPIEYKGWDELVLSHPDYSFFHSSAWAKTLFESYHYTPLYFAVLNENTLSAVVPIMEVNSFLTGKRGVSLPFTDYCEPIVNGNIQFRDLWDCVIEYGKKGRWKSLEIRGGQNHFGTALPSLNYFGHTLDLDENSEELFNLFRESTRRNIRKAIREGVRVEIFNSFDSVRKFYRLNCLTRRGHGLPPQPYKFFKNICQHVIFKGLGFVALALHGGDCIAGAIFFHFGQKAIFKYGASDRQHQRVRANNLVMWEAIKWFSQNGYKSLHLGRTDIGNQGLLQFKAGWGVKQKNIRYFMYKFESEAFANYSSKATDFRNKIFTYLPIPLSRMAGSVFYRHLG